MRNTAPLILFALLVAAVPTLAAKDHFPVNQPFPNIALPSLYDGRPASIADYRGQKVLLHIFASW